MNNMPHDYVEACDWVEEMRAELARLKADRDALLEALETLVDMDHRDNMTNPDYTLTDFGRNQAWKLARAAITQAEKE